jgi:hypothetical protein
MTEINASTSLQELDSIVSQALVAGGVEATLLCCASEVGGVGATTWFCRYTL